ncbi:uncharacterized protein LDX57_001698 [Aspergillus melleus]|uniref:uncharacterized protein n=1 Tax=Aspergillus melleus TaxID=138277 RepID=UPI001E8EDA4A|nr:uncharacterized protein LDX57_001698 [Aspergillus melleus]KAH8423942.1 hypothetical protein LDX57_001698 [Aspergillus melleus]
MAGLPSKSQKSAPLGLDRDSFDSDNPHVEHVEVSQAPEASTEVEPKGSGKPSPTATGPANITSPPRALANARAALQKLTKNPGSKQPDSRRNSPISPQAPPAAHINQPAPQALGSSSTAATTTSSHGMHFDPKYMTLNIYIGHNVRAPRWLLERKFPQSSRASVSLKSPASAADELEWVFDAGPFAYALNSGDSWLRTYAYNVLETTLNDPIERLRIRKEIWDRNDGDYQENEDPIPPLPPAPATLDVTQQEEMGPTPGSRDGRFFQFPDYARPSLAERALPKPESLTHANSTPPRRSRRLYIDSDEEGTNSTPSASIGEYRWIWFIVILLVLSMFLCLFLYAFKII